MWPNLEDLIAIYGILTPSTVLFWYTTAKLLQNVLGGHPVKLVVGFVSVVAITYSHNWFRRNAPATRSQGKLLVYETTFDYLVKLSCLCYALGCRAIFDLLMATRYLHPVLISLIAAVVLLRMHGFRNVLKLPFVVFNDNSADKYRPYSTLTFGTGIELDRVIVT